MSKKKIMSEKAFREFIAKNSLDSVKKYSVLSSGKVEFELRIRSVRCKLDRLLEDKNPFLTVSVGRKNAVLLRSAVDRVNKKTGRRLLITLNKGTNSYWVTDYLEAAFKVFGPMNMSYFFSEANLEYENNFDEDID
jgi:hypothetical protein